MNVVDIVRDGGLIECLEKKILDKYTSDKNNLKLDLLKTWEILKSEERDHITKKEYIYNLDKQVKYTNNILENNTKEYLNELSDKFEIFDETIRELNQKIIDETNNRDIRIHAYKTIEKRVHGENILAQVKDPRCWSPELEDISERVEDILKERDKFWIRSEANFYSKLVNTYEVLKEDMIRQKKRAFEVKKSIESIKKQYSEPARKFYEIFEEAVDNMKGYFETELNEKEVNSVIKRLHFV